MGSTRFDTDDNELIQVIQDSVRNEMIRIGERDFSTRQIFEVPKETFAADITVHSLTAIVDYLKAGVEKDLTVGCYVQVQSPTKVVVNAPIAKQTDRRFSIMVATAMLPEIHFGHFMSFEEANITLQSRFADAGDRAELIQSLSKIVANETLEQSDDGTSQEVTMRAGIKAVNSTVKNPVDLCPFRTFTEVVQPESPFVVRLRKPSDEGMQVAFFEADGGAWKNVACKRIKEFLDEQLKEAGGKVPVFA